MQKDSIDFIITGGTIDSYYDAMKDTAVPNKNSSIPNYIDGLNLEQKITFNEVCMKDSRDLDSSDLKNILKAVKDSESKKIIITHGTYTMSDTARFLEANLEKDNEKTIIFTGSFIPVDGFTFSDGPFQLGYAMARIENLKPGIYIAMNAKVLLASEAMKISKEGKFSSIFGGGIKF